MRAILALLILTGCATQPPYDPFAAQREYERKMDELSKRQVEWCAKNPGPCSHMTFQTPKLPTACLMTPDGVSVCP
jgi:hypothetical protein